MSDPRFDALADSVVDDLMAQAVPEGTGPRAFDWMLLWPIIQQIIQAILERWKQKTDPTPSVA